MNGLKGEEVSQVVVMGREFQEEGKAGAKAWGWELTCCRRNMKEAKGELEWEVEELGT